MRSLFALAALLWASVAQAGGLQFSTSFGTSRYYLPQSLDYVASAAPACYPQQTYAPMYAPAYSPAYAPAYAPAYPLRAPMYVAPTAYSAVALGQTPVTIINNNNNAGGGVPAGVLPSFGVGVGVGLAPIGVVPGANINVFQGRRFRGFR